MNKSATVPAQICWLPLLNVLARTLTRELDSLCAARNKYRAMRKQYWSEPAPVPVNTPYDHVIDRLENALNNTYDNIESITATQYALLRTTH